jgi:hypothetical protein
MFTAWKKLRIELPLPWWKQFRPVVAHKLDLSIHAEGYKAHDHEIDGQLGTYIPPSNFPSISPPATKESAASATSHLVSLAIMDGAKLPYAKEENENSIRAFNRHEKLKRSEFLAARDEIERKNREWDVRELREERDRASEALIVDRRMIQREKTAMVAGMHLETDVKLHKVQCIKEIELLNIKDRIERMKTRHTELQARRQFEHAFTSRSIALMRHSGKESFINSIEHSERERKERSIKLKDREKQQQKRCQDAKTCVFIYNQNIKRKYKDEYNQQQTQKNEKKVHKTKQLIREEKEIKVFLKLI